MSENKRFTCHQMIADYSTGEDIDFDFLQELINEQKQPRDLRMHISDGNKIITYRECVDLLNQLSDENEQLKQFKNIARDYNIPFDKLGVAFEECLNENEQLKQRNKKMLKVMFALKNYVENEDYERINNAVEKIREEILND